jgi:peroxiredoxin
VFALSCAATQHPSAHAPEVTLVAEDGRTVDMKSLAAIAPLTVIIFFSPGCHCLSAHDPRLRALYDADHPRGVQFVAVDSEVGASPERDAAEAARRGYPFPILVDRRARLADALGAKFASFVVVIDDRARVHYRGGIDSDETHLHADAKPYLREALEDLLDHREPALPETQALGCALETW